MENQYGTSVFRLTLVVAAAVFAFSGVVAPALHIAGSGDDVTEIAGWAFSGSTHDDSGHSHSEPDDHLDCLTCKVLNLPASVGVLPHTTQPPRPGSLDRPVESPGVEGPIPTDHRPRAPPAS